MILPAPPAFLIYHLTCEKLKNRGVAEREGIYIKRSTEYYTVS